MHACHDYKWTQRPTEHFVKDYRSLPVLQHHLRSLSVSLLVPFPAPDHIAPQKEPRHKQCQLCRKHTNSPNPNHTRTNSTTPALSRTEPVSSGTSSSYHELCSCDQGEGQTRGGEQELIRGWRSFSLEFTLSWIEKRKKRPLFSQEAKLKTKCLLHPEVQSRPSQRCLCAHVCSDQISADTHTHPIVTGWWKS